MKRSALAALGVLAPIVYILTVVLGGALWPGYSHAGRFVSDLIGSGAPNGWLLIPLFGLYNALVIGFGFGSYLAIRGIANSRQGLGRAGAIVLLLEGLFGVLTLFFPEDPMRTGMTAVGTMHVVMAGLSSVTTMGSMLLIGMWFRGTQRAKNLGLYSFVSVGFVFVTGALTGILGFGAHSPLAGLLERLTVGGFLQWLFVAALTREA